MDRKMHGLLLILAVVIFTLGIYALVTHVSQEQLLKYGYAGVFLVMFVSSATIILPAPGLALVLVAGSVLNPVLVGIFAGAGAGCGELTGYVAGKGGREIVGRGKRTAQVEKWMKRNGFLTILVLAAIPNPVFDVVGIVAGGLQYDWKKFVLAAVLGNVIKATYIAYAGKAALGWIF
jgi:uncharacterized membrane protein YdjX (TVP38/TMEM64 family)